uniref:KIB1-4 beta-propeller domain-containing protein n=1 Tax=Aegilops tauschii TaxID=37682 RepID=N1R0K4_AEGTA
MASHATALVPAPLPLSCSSSWRRNGALHSTGAAIVERLQHQFGPSCAAALNPTMARVQHVAGNGRAASERRMDGRVAVEDARELRWAVEKNRERRQGRKETWALPSTAQTETYRIFGGFGDPRPSVSDEGRGLRFCGSAPGGWFVTSAEPWRGHALLHLRTGERVALPERVRIPLNSGDITCPMMIRAAVMSAEPPSGACFVAAITSSQTNMAFWRPGMDCWLSPPVGMGPARRSTEDLTYYDGWFCAVDSEDYLVCYKPEIAPAGDGASSLTIRTNAYKFHAHGHQTAPGEIVSHYLLPSASGADLLMVKRFISPARGGTCRFQVFSLQKQQDGLPASWRLYQLSGQVLFVGRACSKAFDTGHAGSPGYIYFLDDVYTRRPHSVVQ